MAVETLLMQNVRFGDCHTYVAVNIVVLKQALTLMFMPQLNNIQIITKVK